MRRTVKLLGVVLAFALLGAACGDDDDDAATDDTASDAAADIPDGPAIKVGAQDFGESAILGEIYAGALANAGYDAEVQEVGGFRPLLFDAFEAGDVNMAPDYVASELEFLNDAKGEATSDVDETLTKLTPDLESKG
ncbi:MAG TPA: glycine betaine ABC transporter substrate-binding protein, partial [Acidimicrobiales bacterium]|nr:glycine betaine ABC transporter substrate-binding protein [Acidimicrobiales bacterium]